MDYEKAYKEALEKAREALNDGTISSNAIAYLQDIFPELAESEDENIRKALFKMMLNTPNTECEKIYNISKGDALAWLEKQAPKPQGKTAFEAIHEEKMDNANKVEPPQEIDGFDAELNALLKKYEHLPKEELAESLGFYFSVVRDGLDW